MVGERERREREERERDRQQVTSPSPYTHPYSRRVQTVGVRGGAAPGGPQGRRPAPTGGTARSPQTPSPAQEPYLMLLRPYLRRFLRHLRPCLRHLRSYSRRFLRHLRPYLRHLRPYLRRFLRHPLAELRVRRERRRLPKLVCYHTCTLSTMLGTLGSWAQGSPSPTAQEPYLRRIDFCVTQLYA